MNMKFLWPVGVAGALVMAGCNGNNNGGVTPTPSPTGGPVAGTPATTINVWMTTSVPSAGSEFTQQDRLARPAINEVLAPVSNRRHEINNKISPTGDSGELANDIDNFLTNTAGRSRAITDVIKAVLVPDVLKVDLSQNSAAAYLGVETGGATGGKFGGRKLDDDVVDADLGVVFGKTISTLGLAPDDGKAIPSLTSDNVGSGGKGFMRTFPYLGAPR